MEIRHGKAVSINRAGRPFEQLDLFEQGTILRVADALQKFILHPMKADVLGAKRHNPRACVIARGLIREFKADGAAVGRHSAYVVKNGLAIRFFLKENTRKVVEEWDEKGKVRIAPIELSAFSQTQKLGRRSSSGKVRPGTGHRKLRKAKSGVRAIGGGLTH